MRDTHFSKVCVPHLRVEPRRHNPETAHFIYASHQSAISESIMAL